ncbi:MAG: metal-dependent hydrolase [Gemmatimonadales bacterium]
MPTSVSHALAAGAIGAILAPESTNRRYWMVGVACAVAVDLDAVGRPFGHADIALMGGHRALTHSLPFAVALGAVATIAFFRGRMWDGHRWRIAAYLVLATASHGLLDLLTTYGQGVGLLMPFNWVRYESAWRPVRGLNEIWIVWFPLIAAIVIARWLRSRSAATAA